VKGEGVLDLDISAVVCLDILQLYSTGLRFV